MASELSLDMKSAGHILGIGRNKLIKRLVDKNWIKKTEFGYCTCGPARSSGYVKDDSHIIETERIKRYSSKVKLTALGITTIRQFLEDDEQNN